MALPPFAGGFQPWLRNNSDNLLSVGLGLLSGKTAQEQVGQAAANFANERTLNKTAQYLKSVSPELGAAIENKLISPGDAYKLYYAQKLEASKPRNNFMAVGKNLYDLDNKQWIAPPAGIAANDVEAGLNLVYGKDKDGNTVAFQPLKTGGLRQVEVPQGTSLTPGVTNLDLGTSILTLNSKTGSQVASTPKDVAGAANQKAVGEGQGEAVVALPAATQLATQIDQQIRDLKTDPYLPSMVGSVPYTRGMIQRDDLPDRSPESQRVRSKIDQLKGGSFLQARQILKGGGAITDFEGQKADNAYNRMNTAQSLEDFNKALDDFNDAVKAGVTKLQQQARGNFSGSQPQVPSGSPGATSSGVKWSIEP